MYRSQILYESVKDSNSKIFPICVPTYNRPDALILKSLSKYPELPIILFIRDSKDQKRAYKKWKDKCKIVLLKDVTNIGQTRGAIVDWCKNHKISNIFMLDDDIDELDFLYPHETRNGTLCMRAARQNMNRKYKGINPFVFRMWQKMIADCDKSLTLSTPAYRPDSWQMKHKDAEVKYNNGACIQCIHINIRNLYQKKISYRDTEECGNEDYALQFDVMSSGLKTCVFQDLMYGCPAVGSLSGGNEDACGHSDLKARYTKFINLFLTNVSGTEHEGVRVSKSKSGIPSIKFNWKYWR